MHMTAISRPDAADVLARAGGHWGWLIGFGIITPLVVAMFFGVQLIVAGIFRFVAAFACLAARARRHIDSPGIPSAVGPPPGRPVAGCP